MNQASALECDSCGIALPEHVLNTPEPVPCPYCGAPGIVLVFPALLRKDSPGSKGEALLFDDSAGCFYHPKKQAVVPCDGCGRFLCSLCDIPEGNAHYCSQCVERRVQGSSDKPGETMMRRTQWDAVALSAAVIPALLIWPAIIGAPLAVAFAIRHLRAPQGLLGKRYARAVLALILATAEIGGFGVLLFFMLVSILEM